MGIAYIRVSCVFERAYKSLNLGEFNSSILVTLEKDPVLEEKYSYLLLMNLENI